MKMVNGNIIDFSLEERGENVFDVRMSFNMVPYIGIYSYHVGFIHASLEDEAKLEIISAEIKKVLKEM